MKIKFILFLVLLLSSFARAQLKKIEIKGEIKDPEANKYAYLSRSGQLFLTQDTMHTTAEIHKSTNSRMLMIDSLSIIIENEQNIKYAKVDGGLLNEEFDEMNKAIEKEEYSKFFSSHQNSVMSI